ncbi:MULTISPECIES: hypothetical protein [Falsihalocynthiibacter]|uniref:hypothetical protein n=1 Tax=Falsihalocynthiibacter TaxID=2854182 RepID=UPI003001DB35
MIYISKLGSLFAVLAVSSLGLTSVANGQEGPKIGDLPQALICDKAGITVVGYLAKVDAEGTAFYMTPNDIFVTVSSSGRVDNRSDGSCSDKTLAELRANGQTREFAK